MKDGAEVVGRSVLPTTMEPDKLATGMVEDLLKARQLRLERIKHIVATGQGRKAIRFSDMARTETIPSTAQNVSLDIVVLPPFSF